MSFSITKLHGLTQLSKWQFSFIAICPCTTELNDWWFKIKISYKMYNQDKIDYRIWHWAPSRDRCVLGLLTKWCEVTHAICENMTATDLKCQIDSCTVSIPVRQNGNGTILICCIRSQVYWEFREWEIKLSEFTHMDKRLFSGSYHTMQETPRFSNWFLSGCQRLFDLWPLNLLLPG